MHLCTGEVNTKKIFLLGGKNRIMGCVGLYAVRIHGTGKHCMLLGVGAGAALNAGYVTQPAYQLATSVEVRTLAICAGSGIRFLRGGCFIDILYKRKKYDAIDGTNMP